MPEKVIQIDLDETVRRVKAGDARAFSKIVELHQDYLRAFIATRSAFPQDVDDLAQETFVLAYRKFDELADARALKSWLSSIALNLVRNHTRKHQRSVTEEHEKIEALIDARIDERSEDMMIESLTALKSCMLKLKLENQQLIRQHYVDGLPVKQLTHELGIKHSTMTMRLHRCRQALKECIAKHLQGAQYD